MTPDTRLAVVLLAAASVPLYAASGPLYAASASFAAAAAPLSFGESRDTLPRTVELGLVTSARESAEVLAADVVDAGHADVAADVAGVGSASGDPRVTSDLSSLYYEPDLTGTPILDFEQRQVSFGTVARGDKREHTYRFRNVSDVPATIAIASACTCTTLEWTEGEIAPGGNGEVHAVFDSSEKSAGELIVIDVILEESAPSGNGIIEQVSYDFEIAEADAAPE